MLTQEQKNRQMFWIFKRHSSYTAWERFADAFEKAYQAMEKARPLLFSAPKGRYGKPGKDNVWRDWPMWKTMEETRGEVRYCLKHLSAGDKNVLCNYEILGKTGKTFDLCASFVRAMYYELSGYQKPDGWNANSVPTIPDQENIVRLLADAANLGLENTKFLIFDPWRDRGYHPQNLIRYNFHLYRAIVGPPRVHMDKDFFTMYPIPADLQPLPSEPVLFDDQPAPWWAPADQLKGPYTIKSHEWAKYPGIYQANPEDGIIYTGGGTMPKISNEKRQAVSCEWTLIWLDDRYCNGAPIPEEEALYFPEPPKREELPERLAFKAMPGTPCPKTGMWYANFISNSFIYRERGEIMPGPETNEMGIIIWYWFQAEPLPGAK